MIAARVTDRTARARGADPWRLAEEARAGAIAAFRAELEQALDRRRLSGQGRSRAINKPLVVAILFYLVLLVTMVYGPIAALLVELFPTRIRYTSMSLPYHIGNGWFGGFLPTTAFAMVAATGNIYYGLWYPVVVARDHAGDRAFLPARNLSSQNSRLAPD